MNTDEGGPGFAIIAVICVMIAVTAWAGKKIKDTEEQVVSLTKRIEALEKR